MATQNNWDLLLTPDNQPINDWDSLLNSDSSATAVVDPPAPQSTPQPSKTFDTHLSADEESEFAEWKSKYAPQDSGEDYDLRGAFKAGLTPDEATGHWPDTFKKPNHPTFSNESQYAKDAPDKAGHWEGETYVPPKSNLIDASVDDLLALPETPPAESSGVEILGLFGGTGGEKVPIERTNYGDLPQFMRRAHEGFATVGQAIQSPILRMMGRGDEADRYERALQRLRQYNSLKDENSIFGKTVGPMLGNVESSLSAGTAAAPAGLLGVSSMFGVSGADRAYVDGKDKGLTEAEAQAHAARQGAIDFFVTYWGGKFASAHGAEVGETIVPGLAREATRQAEKIGLTQILKSAGFNSVENAVQELLTVGEGKYAGTDPDDLKTIAKRVAEAFATGGVAGTVAPAIGAIQKKFQKFSEVMPQAKKAVETANTVIKAATDKQSLSPADRGKAGARGLNAGLRFLDSLTPESLESLRRPMSRQQFAKVTGIPKTSQAFRESFRETIELYSQTDKGAGGFYDSPKAPNSTAALGTEPAGEHTRGGTEVAAESTRVEPPLPHAGPKAADTFRQSARAAASALHRGAAKVGDLASEVVFAEGNRGEGSAESKAAVQTWIKTYFTSAGLRNEVIDTANDSRLGAIASDMRRMAQLRTDLDRAVNDAYGGRSKLTPEQIRKIDDALKGSPTDLPQSVLAALEPMRAHVDAMSRRLIDSGVVDPDTDLGLTIENNLGTYLTRTYRKHSEQSWPQQVRKNAELMQQTHDWLKSEFPDDTPDVTEWRINAMLDRDSAAAKAPASMKAGRDFLSVLRERKDLPDLVKQLYGEYRDPWINYTKSVAKMANLLAHNDFISTVRDVGLSTGFLSDESTPHPEHYRRLDGTKTPALKDLAGLYTDPTTAKALTDLFSPELHSSIYRGAVRAAGYAKWAATVGNTVTHVRNFVGNIAFAMSNGDLISRGWGTAIKTTFDDITSRGDDASRAYIQKLAALGLTDTNVDVNDIKKMASEMADLESDGPGAGVWEGVKKAPAAMSQVYQAQDTVWKILAFENKKRQFAKAFPDESFSQIEKRAADDVRRHYPTYAKTPVAVRKIGQFPLFGPFLSFPAEVIRTLKNSLVTIGRDSLSDNPHLREMAQQRAVGLISSLYLVPTISKISKAIFGVTPREEEDLRQFQPPWSENSQFLYLGKSDGVYNQVDLSFMDSRSIITKPLMGLLREGDVGERLDRMVTELVTPLGEDLLMGRVLSLWRNQTPEGRPVYNPAADEATKAREAGAYLGQVVLPGTIKQLDRIRRGAAGAVSKGGKPYDPLLETAALFGLRISSTDVQQSFSFRNNDLNQSMNYAEQGIRQVLTARGTVKPGEIAQAYRRYNEQRRKFARDWHDTAMAAIRLGVPHHEVAQAIASTAGKKEAAMILSGKYTPYLPGRETFGVMRSRPNGNDRVIQLMGLYREAISAEQEQ